MERISKLLEGSDAPLSKRRIRENVTGQSRAKDQALAFLIEEGYVATEPGPHNAVLHRSVKPYRQPAERTNHEVLASTP